MDDSGGVGFNPDSLAVPNACISFVKRMAGWRSFGNKAGKEGLLVFIRH